MTTPTRPIEVRAPRFRLGEEVPLFWCADSPLATYLVNGLSLLFPEGERSFIESVRYFKDKVEEDPELMRQVRLFFAQEGRHGHAHDLLNRRIAEQGYDVEGFLEFYRDNYIGRASESFPPELQLAITAALEHMTATLAELALDSPLLDEADPEVRALLLWHATEEIEHKAVAFDVLRKVDPRYRTRVGGYALAAFFLFFFWGVAVRGLYRTDRAREVDRRPRHPAGAEGRFFLELGRQAGRLFGSLADYLRVSFHPDDRDNYALARAYMDSYMDRAAPKWAPTASPTRSAGSRTSAEPSPR